MKSFLLETPARDASRLSDFTISQLQLAYILILSLSMAAFYPALDNSFVHWDDQYYVTDNIYIIKPTLENLHTLLTKVTSLNYHPLTMISLWLNSLIAGVDSAFPYILTNMVVHSLTALIVCRMVYAVTDSNLFVAALTALTFAIHPMHVESVVWVSERKDVLYAFFFFSSLLFYHKYLLTNLPCWWVLSVVLFLASCLSKAMAVSMVPVLLLLHYMVKGKWYDHRLLVSLLPYVVVGLATGLIAVDVQAGGDFYGLLSNTNTNTAISATAPSSLSSVLATMGYGLGYYLGSFIYPVHMSPYHPYVDFGSGWVSTAHAVVPFLLGGILLWSIHQRRRYLVFGLGFFVATIVLVLQWLPVGTAVVADRYTYLPYVGLGFLLAIFLYRTLYRRPAVMWSIGVVLCLVMFTTTRVQSDVWQDHTTLFQSAVEEYPEDAKSRLLLATGQWTGGDYSGAIDNLEYAINNLGLYSSEAFEKLANCYDELGDRPKAMAYYNHSISLDSLNYVARYHRGLLLMAEDPAAAIMDFDICESSGFEYVMKSIYGPRAVCLGRLGHYQAAITDFSKAIDLGMDVAYHLESRAITYELMGREDLATADRQRLQDLQE